MRCLPGRSKRAAEKASYRMTTPQAYKQYMIYVYTDWSIESIREGFAEEQRLFYLLTNSRGFTAEQTTAAHREIAAGTAAVSRKTGISCLIISRGDSTLRGRCPLETELLKAGAEAAGQRIDGEILCPFFREEGRAVLPSGISTMSAMGTG